MKNNKLSLTRILEISIPAVIVFAVSWGVFTTKINQTDAEIDTLTTKYETMLELKTDVGIIKSQVGDLRNDMSDIKRALNVK